MIRYFVFAVALVVACSGTKGETGIGEPIRLENAVFESGDWPAGGLPTVTALETASTVVRPSEAGKALSGRTSPDAFAVAVRLADVGSGYWVFPVGGPDPQNNGELTWQTTADFGANVPVGPHVLRVVAVDANGAAGSPRDLTVCMTPPIPDNLNACDEKILPPSAILSLSWDAPADVDLVVVTPDGRIVDAKHPRTVAPPPPGPATPDAGAAVSVGTFDRDSNANCVVDNLRREDLVFQSRPPAGSYLVYARLFAACGTPAVHFTFSLFEPAATADPAVQHLVESITKHGVLLPLEASGGATLGTFVTEVSF